MPWKIAGEADEEERFDSLFYTPSLAFDRRREIGPSLRCGAELCRRFGGGHGGHAMRFSSCRWSRCSQAVHGLHGLLHRSLVDQVRGGPRRRGGVLSHCYCCIVFFEKSTPEPAFSFRDVVFARASDRTSASEPHTMTTSATIDQLRPGSKGLDLVVKVRRFPPGSSLPCAEI